MSQTQSIVSERRREILNTEISRHQAQGKRIESQIDFQAVCSGLKNLDTKMSNLRECFSATAPRILPA